LIGSEVFWDLLCVGQIRLTPTQSILQKTKLGWILVGSLTIPVQRSIRNQKHVCHLITTQQLAKQVAKFWEVEECSIPDSRKWSRDEQFL